MSLITYRNKNLSISALIILLCFAESLFQPVKSDAKDGKDTEDDQVCLLYSGKNYSGSPLLSLTPTVKVFETNLLFYSDSDSLSTTNSSTNSSSSNPLNGVRIQSVRLAKTNCSVILCNDKHLQGDCIQLEKNSADISSENDEFAVEIYKNVRSVDCHCSDQDPNDIVSLLVPMPSPSGKLKEKIEGYPPATVPTMKSTAACAVLFRDWHFKGQSFSLDFAGSAANLKSSDFSSRVRSIFVKDGCTLSLWSRNIQPFSVSSQLSFLQKNDTEQYDWACCSCDKCSSDICDDAQKTSNQVSSFNSPVSMNGDFSQFVKYGKKIIGIGRNYIWTKVELAKVLSIPKKPIVFLKPTTSYIREGQKINLPKTLGTIFYELELGVVIGKQGTNIPEDKALDHVAGYFLALDMTAKEFIKGFGNKSLPWEVGKGFDTACPVGDYIPKSQLPDPNNVHLECKLNGEVTQSESTKNMIFNVQQLISYISTYMTLEPYDVILTGTPDGFGPVKDGDILEGRLGNLTSIKFIVGEK